MGFSPGTRWSSMVEVDSTGLMGCMEPVQELHGELADGMARPSRQPKHGKRSRLGLGI